MNAPLAKVKEDMTTYSQEDLTVAIETFQGDRKGHLLALAYGESDPETNYIGGGEYWVRLTEDPSYKFAQAQKVILSNRSGDLSEAILSETSKRYSGIVPWHVISLTPGGAFASQDLQFINAFCNTVEAAGDRCDFVSIVDGNGDFITNAERQMGQIGVGFIKPENILSSQHDIYTTSLGNIHPDNVKNTKRRSVIIWAGGTIGNIGYRKGEIDFPDEAIISMLQKQVDHSAEECYVVVLHNAFNEAAVLDYYTSEANDNFVLSSLHEIERRLPTEDFDPQKFDCKRRYDPENEVVEHAARSKEDQTFFIGERGFRMAKDQQVVIGYSAQITRNRMGNVSSRGGFSRVTSYGQKMNGNPRAEVVATALKATDDLMDALRQGRKYRVQPRAIG